MPRAALQVSDPADPRLRDYANLTDADLRDADWSGARGVFIAEGELVVRRLLSSRFPVRSLLVTQAGLERIGDAINASTAPVYVAPTSLMEAIVGFKFHRGILACGQRLPDPPLGDILSIARTLIILEDLANADNVGAVFRNLAALAGPRSAVLLSPGCCDPLYRKALRVSIGHALTIPFARLPLWPTDLAHVQDAGFELLALTPSPDAKAIAAVAGRGWAGQARAGPDRLALLLGAEGPGLSPPVLARARPVQIPMAQGADSLNVATAAAVALALLVRPE